MGQHAFFGVEALGSNDQASIDKWIAEWQNLPLGSRTSLPKSCDQELNALLLSVEENNAMAFMPRRSPTPASDTARLCHIHSACPAPHQLNEDTDHPGHSRPTPSIRGYAYQHMPTRYYTSRNSFWTGSAWGKTSIHVKPN